MLPPYQRIRGAVILYAFGSLVTLVAAVVINNRYLLNTHGVNFMYHCNEIRFVVESLKIGVEKIGNRRLRFSNSLSKFNTMTFHLTQTIICP